MKKTNLSEYDATRVPSVIDCKVAVVVAEWNPEITNSLLQGAVDTLVEHGVATENIRVVHVPGSYELSSGADMSLSYCPDLDGVICLGCVIQGDTRHFDFICEAVAQGLTNVALHHHKPVIFGLLTTNNYQQALDRCGGKHGNKGVEAAVTLLKMVSVRRGLLSLNN